ncbi:cation-independent mannose-6-phosphate receptor-like protein [Dinothrombium tinctorium]|uniref:Cation-independent mannose-6-phosphate receptor-like protein n=1 Tax=Dinothrombium tinctorium TaxID=1965070 RepID=A0A443REG1_9ACAR|nr:cation-independent mannose-6-phosphate receptor-like protein [Dinothrombium tinctorium]
MSTAAATSGHCLLAIVACLSVILQTLAAFRATTTISRTNESSRSETRVPTFDCSVRIDQNTVYDLSLLRRHSGEAAFVATTAAFDTKSRYAIKRSELIFLNICGHLPNASDESNACIKQHPNTAVCLLDQSTNQTRSLGDFDANTSLNFNNQTTALQLIYYYRNETIVEINLFCSPGNTDSSPILLEMKKRAGRIKYFFDWQISAACPSGISVGSNCSVVESNLGVLFDLNSLQTTNSYIASSKDHIFYLNVCGEAKECGTGFAACLYSKNNTKQALLGKVNSSLIYFHGVLKLIYEDRSQYNNKTVPFRRTEIDFICNETIGKGEPKFLSEANSTYFFKWETKYACRFPIATANCVWQNGTHTIDLGPLSLAQGNHFAHYFGFEHFLINVCKPVNPFNALGTSVSCGRNVGICKIDWQNNNKTFSYGQPLDPPFQLYDGSIALKYQNGDPCPTNHSKRTKSIIRFLCDQSEDTGFPIFKGKFENEDECTFMFDWKTFFVCSPKRIYLEDQCRFKDNRTGLEADLSDIDADSSESRLIHVFLGEIETLSINVCKISNYFNSPACKDAVVCLKRNDKTFLSLGNIHHKEAQFDGKNSSKVPAVESIDEKDRDGKSSLGSVILVFLLLIILAFVGFVLFSEERRTNVARRIRRLFGPTITPSFQYSQVSSDSSKLVQIENDHEL